MGDLTVINVVTDFGAIGNGLANDAPAINNALSAVPTSPEAGAIVYFPPGNYLISEPLTRQVSNTTCLGAGMGATTITIQASAWASFFKSAQNNGFVFELASTTSVTNCSVLDMTIDGNARNMHTLNPIQNYAGGIRCSLEEYDANVTFYDIWGWAVWLGGPNAAYAKVIDCIGDSPSSPATMGNDCIGGDPYRALVQRFHWTQNMSKTTALDFTNAGGGAECSIDIIECINESAHDVVLEGCIQSKVVGCRFYSNGLLIQSDAAYKHEQITNPSGILVTDCLFSFGTCKVLFDGGDNIPADYMVGSPTIPGRNIALIGNRFQENNFSPILWAGDDESTSFGGSIIANNTISDPAQKSGTGTTGIPGLYPPPASLPEYHLGYEYGSGISVLSSYGLVISGNTIHDTSSGPENMQYSIQLASAEAQNGPTGRILVTGNYCGLAPGVGNGAVDTFYLGTNTSAANPFPIVTNNTNQDKGYDATASGQISNGTPWPPAKGYPYNVLVSVSGSTASGVSIGGEATGAATGNFYVPVGQTITVSWSGARPSIVVFRC